jgi:hypothetical protein
MTQMSRLEEIRARLDTPFERISLADLDSMHFMLAEIDRLAERVRELEAELQELGGLARELSDEVLEAMPSD